MFPRRLKKSRIGWQDGFEVGALTIELSCLGWNLNPDMNRHPGVSRAGRCVNVCTVHEKDVKPEDPFASTSP